MSAITFDALAFVKKLKHVGVSEAQAEVEAQVFMELVEKFGDNLVTHTDLHRELKVTKYDLYRELKTTKDDLQRELKTTKDDLHRELKATKDDLHRELKATKEDLYREIKATKDELQYEIKKLESHLIIRLASTVGIMLSIAVAILALIIKL
jgi:type III secretory pathway component EscU